MIQPPEEPREQRLGEVQPKSYIKFLKKTKDQNGQITMVHFWKKVEKS